MGRFWLCFGLVLVVFGCGFDCELDCVRVFYGLLWLCMGSVLVVFGVVLVVFELFFDLLSFVFSVE